LTTNDKGKNMHIFLFILLGAMVIMMFDIEIGLP
jgi:hypothetical protein